MTEAHPATTGQPIDLDEFAKRVEVAVRTVRDAAESIESEWGDGNGYDIYEVADELLGTDVPRLVAEVRAAREVIEAAAAYRGRLSGGGAVDKWAHLAAALAKYEQAVGGARSE